VTRAESSSSGASAGRGLFQIAARPKKRAHSGGPRRSGLVLMSGLRTPGALTLTPTRPAGQGPRAARPWTLSGNDNAVDLPTRKVIVRAPPREVIFPLPSLMTGSTRSRPRRDIESITGSRRAARRSERSVTGSRTFTGGGAIRRAADENGTSGVDSARATATASAHPTAKTAPHVCRDPRIAGL
jgi:hypothetical protein